MIEYRENKWAYEMGFTHGLDKSISPPTCADRFYTIGFNIARKTIQTA